MKGESFRLLCTTALSNKFLSVVTPTIDNDASKLCSIDNGTSNGRTQPGAAVELTDNCTSNERTQCWAAVEIEKVSSRFLSP